MRFVMSIDMDDDELADDPSALARIVTHVAARLHDEVSDESARTGNVRDSNGNTVGRYNIER